MSLIFHKTAGGRLLRLLCLKLLVGGLAATAQPDGHYARSDSANGYWKVQTDYTSRNTIIRFFNARHEPIYQETLRGRYVKLTNRTIRLFDATLQRLMANELLSSQLKSYELVAARSDQPYLSYRTPTSAVYNAAPPAETTTPEARPLRINTYLSSVGKLTVLMANARQEPVLVLIFDEQGRAVFKEQTRLSQYRLILNLAHLEEGKFRFEIREPQSVQSYRLTVTNEPRSYQLRPLR